MVSTKKYPSGCDIITVMGNAVRIANASSSVIEVIVTGGHVKWLNTTEISPLSVKDVDLKHGETKIIIKRGDETFMMVLGLGTSLVVYDDKDHLSVYESPDKGSIWTKGSKLGELTRKASKR